MDIFEFGAIGLILLFVYAMRIHDFIMDYFYKKHISHYCNCNECMNFARLNNKDIKENLQKTLGKSIENLINELKE